MTATAVRCVLAAADPALAAACRAAAEAATDIDIVASVSRERVLGGPLPACDVLLVADAPGAPAAGWAEDAARASPGVAVVLLAEDAGVEAYRAALRVGACAVVVAARDSRRAWRRRRRRSARARDTRRLAGEGGRRGRRRGRRPRRGRRERGRAGAGGRRGMRSWSTSPGAGPGWRSRSEPPMTARSRSSPRPARRWPPASRRSRSSSRRVCGSSRGRPTPTSCRRLRPAGGSSSSARCALASVCRCSTLGSQRRDPRARRSWPRIACWSS